MGTSLGGGSGGGGGAGSNSMSRGSGPAYASSTVGLRDAWLLEIAKYPVQPIAHDSYAGNASIRLLAEVRHQSSGCACVDVRVEATKQAACGDCSSGLEHRCGVGLLGVLCHSMDRDLRARGARDKDHQYRRFFFGWVPICLCLRRHPMRGVRLSCGALQLDLTSTSSSMCHALTSRNLTGCATVARHPREYLQPCRGPCDAAHHPCVCVCVRAGARACVCVRA
jgi:hypothetical protein